MTGNLPPPSDVEAERAVVAHLLQYPDDLADALDHVSPPEFYDAPLREVFAAIARLAEAGQAIDLVSVNAELRKADKSSLAPSTLLSELLDVPSSHLRQNARRIRSRARQRAMLSTLLKLAADGRSESVDPDEWVERVQAEVFALATQTDPSPPEDIAETTHKTLDVLRDRERGVLDYVPTTIATLNRRIHGWIPGIQVIAARPGEGKTALALQEAVNFAQRGKAVVFASLEMDRLELTERLLSQLGVVNNEDMLAGYVTRHWPKLTEAAEIVRSLPIAILDDSTLTVGQLRAKVRREFARLRRKHGPIELGAIFVDYLQLMTGQGNTREQVVASISAGLRVLAKDLGVPLIALSQLNRGTARDGGPPGLADLRESGAIEQDAKRVVMIWNQDASLPPDEQGTTRTLIVAKARGGGSCGRAQCVFDGPHTRFFVRAHESHDGVQFDNE